MLVYVGGVPAVGKTSIIREAERLAGQREIGLKRTIGTDIMCELAGVSSVEKLRRLPEATRRELRPEMNRRIYEQDRLDPATIRVCDGHFCFFDIEGENYGQRQIQPWDSKQMKGFVVVVANPQTILRRRIQDGNERPDRHRDVEFIDREQRLEVQIAINQAKELDLPISFLDNGSEMSVSEAAELLLAQIARWLLPSHSFVMEEGYSGECISRKS